MLRRNLLRLLAAVVFITAVAVGFRPHGPALAGGDLLVVPVCTGSGESVMVALGPDGSPVVPEPAAAEPPCLLCAGLPGAEVPPAPIFPSLDRLIQRHDLTRADAAPRAPPLLLAPDHPPTAPPAMV
ncbi:MAG: hypothetical protein RML45_08585 [Acetobacteraceae bacterium]|nr:hypothetical protein [Acetobacteraceae bacterium]